jgi:hypothetical protein
VPWGIQRFVEFQRDAKAEATRSREEHSLRAEILREYRMCHFHLEYGFYISRYHLRMLKIEIDIQK